MFFYKNIGLALGGGGARGITFLGILKVLEDNNLAPDIIAGTSMGAIIGAAYATKNYSINELIRIFESVLYSQMFDELGLSFIESMNKHTYIGFVRKLKDAVTKLNFLRRLETNRYLVEGVKFEKVLRVFLPDKNIEDLPVKFAAVALDMKTKRAHTLDKGPLIRAVMASSAIPGIFQPVAHNDTLLTDGGWIEIIPVPAALKLGAKKVIAADLRHDFDLMKSQSAMELMNNAGKVVNDLYADTLLKDADLVLNVRIDSEWYDFHNYRKLIQAGERAAMANLKTIKNIFRQQRNIFSFLRQNSDEAP